jgi:hypothetical protein
MVKKINIDKINYKVNLGEKETRIMLSIVIILLIVLLFRKNLLSLIEKIILFTIIFLLILIISKNLVVAFIGAAIIFLLFNLLIGYRDTFENFQDMEKDIENKVKANLSTDDETLQKSKNGIQELLKQVNGGIKLNEEDLKETDKLNINLDKYKDDKTPNALKIAQKETYELINTVNALKDTITTLAPVLSEGKKIMSMFENIKI